MTTDYIAAMLRAPRFRYSSEADLQEAIATLFTNGAVAHEREAILTKGERIDFLLGDVGVEVKIAGSPAEIFRQLLRYAELPQIASLIVVTDKTRIVRGLPSHVLGKPLAIVSLAEASL